MCLGACTVSIFSCSTTATRLGGPFFSIFHPPNPNLNHITISRFDRPREEPKTSIPILRFLSAVASRCQCKPEKKLRIYSYHRLTRIGRVTCHPPSFFLILLVLCMCEYIFSSVKVTKWPDSSNNSAGEDV
jgi:hypothetical protein